MQSLPRRSGDAARRDEPQAEKFVPTTKASEPPQPKSEAIGVLTMREAATRLGISTSEMEAMVERGDGEVADGGVDDDGADERGG